MTVFILHLFLRHQNILKVSLVELKGVYRIIQFDNLLETFSKCFLIFYSRKNLSERDDHIVCA